MVTPVKWISPIGDYGITLLFEFLQMYGKSGEEGLVIHHNGLLGSIATRVLDFARMVERSRSSIGTDIA